MPVFVISRVAADAMVTETEVWSLRVSGWSAAAVNAVAALADVIAVPDRAFDGAALAGFGRARRHRRRRRGSC